MRMSRRGMGAQLRCPYLLVMQCVIVHRSSRPEIVELEFAYDRELIGRVKAAGARWDVHARRWRVQRGAIEALARELRECGAIVEASVEWQRPSQAPPSGAKEPAAGGAPSPASPRSLAPRNLQISAKNRRQPVFVHLCCRQLDRRLTHSSNKRGPNLCCGGIRRGPCARI